MALILEKVVPATIKSSTYTKITVKQTLLCLVNNDKREEWKKKETEMKNMQKRNIQLITKARKRNGEEKETKNADLL